MTQSPGQIGPRHCPSQAYAISPAVCRARQGANFFLCPQCEHRGEATDGPANGAVSASRGDIERIFRADDVFGRYPDPLDEASAWRAGHAAANFLRSLVTGYARSERQACSIVLARDTRPGSAAVAAAAIEGISSTDTDVIDLGQADGPMVCFAVNRLGACGGIMVTASHAPAEFTGLRICGQGGKPIIHDTGLVEIRRIAQAIAAHRTAKVHRIERDLLADYAAFVRGFSDADLRPITLAVDASNGTAARVVPVVLAGRPVRIVPMSFQADEPWAHEPDPAAPANLVALSAAVRQGGADLGVCFDSDADRCAFVDETGQPVPTDVVAALIAPALLARTPGGTIVYDGQAGDGLAEVVRAAGGTARAERGGPTAIRKTLAECKGLLGVDLAGQFYFRDHWFGDSGVLALVHVLNAVSRARQPVSQRTRPVRA